MVATLARSGSNSWSLGDKRYFDAWGDVEQGAGTGQPSQRYCANLGHVQDDESDLIYMRARYHEPGVGRFLSQDVSHDGSNWYIYCGNNPVSRVDPSGNFWEEVAALTFSIGMAAALAALGLLVFKQYDAAVLTLKAATALIACSIGLSDDVNPDFRKVATLVRLFCTDAVLAGIFSLIAGGMDEAKRKNAVGVTAVVVNVAYLLGVLAVLGDMYIEGEPTSGG